MNLIRHIANPRLLFTFTGTEAKSIPIRLFGSNFKSYVTFGNILYKRMNASNSLTEYFSDAITCMRETQTPESKDLQKKISKINEKQMTFISHPNPVTGKMDWIVQDEDYDFTQEIARSGYGDMLHDTDRNKKYYEAIIKTVSGMKAKNISVNVLDIGTGTGLLSMMAATAGAEVITACEAFPPIAECAKKVVKANSFQEKIKIVSKRSTDVLLEDLPKKANLLITELFDTELIGEGAIWSYKDALSRLMEEGCYAVPARACIYIQAVQSCMLREFNDLHMMTLPNGERLHIPESFSHCGGAPSLHDLQVDELEGDLTFVSKPLEVFRFDFSKISGLLKDEYVEKKMTALCSGNVDAFVMWWDLDMDMDGEIVLSCAPKWCRPQKDAVPWRDHWMQAVYYPAAPLPVSAGEQFSVHCSHDEYSLWFDTQHIENCRPVCTCGLHIAFSRSRLGQINNTHRNQQFVQCLKKHITCSTVCLVISDGSLLPIIANNLGAQKVFYLDSNSTCRRLIKQVIESNNLKNIKILEKDAEELSAQDFDGLKIDLVIAEPYFQASSLPWEHLYFWYAASSLSEFLSPDVEILPNGMTIKAMALEFRDLHKIRIPVGNCEGFDISEFDKLIESSSSQSDPSIEPQPLWEYPSCAMSNAQVVLSLDLNKKPERLTHSENNGNIQLFRDGFVNGVGFWTEFHFGDGFVMSNGVEQAEEHVEIDSQKNPVKWDKYSRQGVHLFKENISTHQCSSLAVTAQFTPQTGDFAINVIPDISKS